jgi:hypothetical protein
MDDHLAGCALCRRQLRGMKPVQAALDALLANLQTVPLPAPDHLSRAKLRSYAADRLDEIERELAESHLESCPQCTERLSKLRANSGAAWWNRLIPQAGLAALLSRARIATAVVVTAALALSGVLWLRMSRNEVAVNTRPSPSTDQTPAVLPQPPAPTGPSPAPVTLALNDGGKEVTLDAGGQVSGLDGILAEYQQLVASALRSGQIKTPAELSELRGRSGRMMGGSGADRFDLISPVGKVVLSDRPTLRWQALGGAESYIATIIDPADNFNEVVKSPPLTLTNWQVDRALRRGRTYTWQVTATRDGQQITAPALEAGDAKFKVLDQARANELARVKTNYPGRHLLLGLVYAQAGLLDEAERELKALVEANPQSNEVWELLQSLQSERRER